MTKIVEHEPVRRVCCPNCLEEAASEAARTITDAGLERTFECANCGNVWAVIF